MRITELALGAVLVLAAPVASAVNQTDFEVRTTRDLVSLCSATQGSDMYGAAMGYCLGFVDAAHDYHAAITSGDMVKPITCPGHKTTRQEVVDMFLAWAKANDGLLDNESPIQGLMRAASAKWPC
mgnify:CR=1 FL=1|jgi:hypothetical protein